MAVKSNIKSITKLVQKIEKVVRDQSLELSQQMLQDTADEAKIAEGFSHVKNGRINVANTSDGATLEVTGERAAYVEFGTGSKVFQEYEPADGDDNRVYKDYAKNYYVDGSGRLPQSPYLFPALFRNRDEFIENLKKEIKKAVK